MRLPLMMRVPGGIGCRHALKGVVRSIRSGRSELLVAVIGVLVSALPLLAHQRSEQLRQSIEGEQLFRAYCATCHGLDGKGNGPTALVLTAPPADLTLIALRNMGTFPRDRVTSFVANGDASTSAHGSKDMPVWGPIFEGLAPASSKLINPRIEDVVSYVESIQVR